MVNKEKSRMDIIGQNGNTGEHYEEVMPNGRWNWYGEGEDEPVWKEDKLGGKAANLRDMWKVHDQNEEARKKMNRHSAYNAKFWIYEEKRFGTWEESQNFYKRQYEKEKLLRAASVANSLSAEELAAVRDRLVAEG
jgi:hypothetical protein